MSEKNKNLPSVSHSSGVFTIVAVGFVSGQQSSLQLRVSYAAHHNGISVKLPIFSVTTTLLIFLIHPPHKCHWPHINFTKTLIKNASLTLEDAFARFDGWNGWSQQMSECCQLSWLVLMTPFLSNAMAMPSCALPPRAGTANPSWARIVIPILLSHQLISERPPSPSHWQLPLKALDFEGIKNHRKWWKKNWKRNNGFNVRRLMKNTCLFTETVQRRGEGCHPITLYAGDEAQPEQQMVLIA